MKRARHSEEQIIAVLQEAQAGSTIEELCRRHGISAATYYKWKQKFGGLEVKDASVCACWRKRTASSKSWWLTKPSTTWF